MLKHPFAVTATLERSVVLTFSVDAQRAAALVPAPLELDLYNGCAFIAAAMVQTRGLRPARLPSWFGRDFGLIGYRLFVQHRNAHKRRRGLFILRSETNSRIMRILGGLLTTYRYRFSDIEFRDSLIRGPDLEVRYAADDAAQLPKHSPFPDWRAARRYAGPMPFTFSVHGSTLLSVRGRRSQWNPLPLTVLEAQVPILSELGFEETVLANAFMVQNVPYRWERGEREPWR